jgi:hypothetical protein
LNTELDQLKNKKSEINKQEVSLDFAPTEYPELDTAEMELIPLTDFWDLTVRITERLSEWQKKFTISQLNHEEIDKEMKMFNK